MPIHRLRIRADGAGGVRIEADRAVLVPVTVVVSDAAAARPVGITLRSAGGVAYVWMTVDEARQLRNDLKAAVLEVRDALAAAGAAASDMVPEFSGPEFGGLPEGAGPSHDARAHLPPLASPPGGDLFAGRRAVPLPDDDGEAGE